MRDWLGVAAAVHTDEPVMRQSAMPKKTRGATAHIAADGAERSHDSSSVTAEFASLPSSTAARQMAWHEAVK